MVYTKQTWENLPARTTPLSAARLTHIEDGIGDLGTFAAFSPSLSNVTVGNGTLVGRYTQFGKTVLVSVTFTYGSTSSVSPGVALTLPVTARSTSSLISCEILLRDISPAMSYVGAGRLTSTSALGVNSVVVSGSNVVQASTTSTVPFTWATGDFMEISASYEAA